MMDIAFTKKNLRNFGVVKWTKRHSWTCAKFWEIMPNDHVQYLKLFEILLYFSDYNKIIYYNTFVQYLRCKFKI